MTLSTYQKVFEYAPNPIAILDEKFNFISVNKLYAQADNKDISEFPGHNHFDFYPSPENEEIFLEVVKTKKPYITKARPFSYKKNPERGVTYWDWSLIPILDSKNEVEILVLSLINVTEQIESEKTLKISNEELKQETIQRKYSEAHLKAIFDNSKLGIVTSAIDGKVIQSNVALENMLGYTQVELANMNCDALSHPEDIKKDQDKVIEVFCGERDHYEMEKRYLKKDGSILWVNLTLVLAESANFKFVISFFQDITEKKQYQDQMVKLDRLNLIGEMAAGISHEVRNPMTTVRGFLQILRSKKDFCGYIDYFDLMIEELDRSNAIITEFLSIGRNIPSNLQKENLNNIVESLSPLIEASAFKQENYLEVETSEVPDLLLNNKEIRQVLLNLCQNGFEAMSPGGTLKIMTFSQGEDVILAVQDEGEGIEPEVLEKLGTPFFTTKENGTGLGLGVCYSIAARHNANISFKTGPKGTTSYVKFKVDNMVSDKTMSASSYDLHEVAEPM